MKTLVAAALLMLLSSGCCIIVGEHQLPDGSSVTVKSYRVLWQSEGIEFSEPGGGKLKVSKSRPDSNSIEAAARGAAQGAAQAVAP